MSSWLQIARWQDAVDVVAVAVLAWVAIRYLRHTRARAALIGLAFLGVLYAASSSLGLRLTTSLFQGFFAALVIVVVVVFQDDLRRLFEQLGSWRPGRPLVESDELDVVSLLTRVVSHLAEHRTGGLIVIPGQEPLDSHVEGGIALAGRISEPLLLSLFDASSPGHDGAVIVRGDLVERFAVHLPLSANRDVLGDRGTRHAAALGLAERCDAICIVVSEERGTISVAQNGAMRRVSIRQLPGLLAPEVVEPEDETPLWQRRAWLDALVAVVGAAILWIVLVPGSDVAELVVPASVDVANLPDDLALDAIDPPLVDVTLRGLRRDLILADRNAVSVTLDAYLARLGRRTFSLEESDVHRPDDLSVVEIAPERVRLSLRAASPNGTAR